MRPSIEIRGACENNLKNVDCDFPRGRFIVVSGPSGSGKSSLVFDTLFREAERRSLAALGREGEVPAPRVRSVSGLSFTAALRRRVPRSHFSTVATASDLYPLLRTMALQFGEEHCPNCEAKIAYSSPQEMFERAAALPGEIGVFAVVSGDVEETREKLLRQGYTRALVDGALLPLEHAEENPILAAVDLVPSAEHSRLSEALLLAAEIGDGQVALSSESGEARMSAVPRCLSCGTRYEPLDRADFSFYLGRGACPRCRGTGKISGGECRGCLGLRLAPRALHVRLRGKSFREILSASIGELARWIQSTAQEPAARDKPGTEKLRTELAARLGRLERLGLHYLELRRDLPTLSAGEAQRVLLARFLAGQVDGVSYLLDEPASGLHPRDIARLLEELRSLVAQGNTIIAVEHDLDFVRAADRVVDMGPGAGPRGGEIVSSGAPDVIQQGESETGRALRRQPAPVRQAGERAWPKLSITGARKHNLKDLSLEIPLEALVVISGVSGSGKSTLVRETIVPALKALTARRRRGRPVRLTKDEAGRFSLSAISGWEPLHAVYDLGRVFQARSLRSSVASRAGVLDELRRLYAQTLPARALGLAPRDFRAGDPRLAAIAFRGVSFSEALQLTVQESREHFARIPRIAAPLERAAELGLGYLRLGESLRSISAGEYQRLVLARFLTRASERRRLFVLDEPTQGLHPREEELLVGVLRRLVEKGDSVIVIEHSKYLRECSDYVIELGPEGGEQGGRVVYAGTP